MNLIDTHCHLPSLEHSPLPEILERAEKAHVTKMVCIGAGSAKDAAFEAVALAEKYPQVWASVGIHPHDAGSTTDIEGLKSLFAKPKVVALGETGLDFFRDWAPKDKQVELFESSIILALELNLPLIIHCRAAEEDTLATLKKLGAEKVGGVFHCYGGDAPLAAVLREMNFLVSITGTVTFKGAHALRETVKEIPLTQLMLETDAPYMAPEPFRGGPSEPAHVLQVAQMIAKVKGITVEEVAETTTATALKFFRI